MGHYSQKDEDIAILRSVAHLPTGRFLDIGAYDGIRYSNTYALVEKGWSGIMVEPGLEAFQALLGNHGGNEKLTLIHAAITVEAGAKKFWNCPTTFSTTEPSNRDKFIHEGFSQPFWVQGMSLEQLWYGFCCAGGSLDVLSIDTEGTSVDLFKRFLARGFARPRCICVEHDGRKSEVMQAIVGYKVIMENEENIVLEAA